MNMNMAQPKAAATSETAIWINQLTAYRIKRGALLYWSSLFAMSAAIIRFIGVLKQPPPSWLLVIFLLAFTIIQAGVAVSVLAVPARRLLLAAGVIEAVGLLVWSIAHAIGLPCGFSVWRPETLGVPDLYIPVMEGASTIFFLCLGGRTWRTAPSVWRMTFKLLPSLFILGLMVYTAGVLTRGGGRHPCCCNLPMQACQPEV